nr:LRR receptor-like serine/threonine-protein kinase EFR [Coffea arabica]
MGLVQQVNGAFQFAPPGPISVPPKRRASKSTAPEAGSPSTDALGLSFSAPPPSSSADSQLAALRFQMQHMDTRMERMEHQMGGMAQNLAQYLHHVDFERPEKKEVVAAALVVERLLLFPWPFRFYFAGASAPEFAQTLEVVVLTAAKEEGEGKVFNLIIPAASLSGNETDLLALLDFKNQISDDPNGILKSWNASKHHCQWFGVTCGQNQRVIGLNLFGQSLVGSISPHVGNLTFMNFINLRNNRYFGEIPKEVGRLFQLTYLNLTNNSLGGEIPVTLSNCSRLKTIDILRNRLVGNIPFELGSLKKLKSLFLGRNNLTGEIPKSIGNLTSLTQIYLSYNNLEGHLPEELGQLTSLYSIGIDVNFLSGTIPASLYNVSSVAGTSLSSNSLEGQIPDNMGLTLPNIQEFLIGGNQFKGTIPVSLANASLLAKLDLVSNKFRGQVPTNLGKLPNLYWLNFAGNFLGSNSTGDMDFIASLSNCSNLQSLLFSQNNFGGTLPDSIGNLSNTLQQIDLALNQISGEIPTGLGNLANLYLLGMDHNLFSGSVPSFFGKFRMLQKLFLNNNQLSSQIPPSLFNMTSLYGLYLSENRLEGNLPSLIGNSQSLREMILSKNNLNGSIPLETFSFLSSLTLLNLTQPFFGISSF